MGERLHRLLECSLWFTVALFHLLLGVSLLCAAIGALLP